MTTGQTQNRVFRSYEQLERELMPKRAKELRARRMEGDLRKTLLEIKRRPITDAVAAITDAAAAITDAAAEQQP